ncbi:MAG: hypothetical protein ACRYGB_09050 [Janthinobacterium lividum]
MSNSLFSNHINRSLSDEQYRLLFDQLDQGYHVIELIYNVEG